MSGLVVLLIAELSKTVLSLNTSVFLFTEKPITFKLSALLSMNVENIK
jgi:hypothetical protein